MLRPRAIIFDLDGVLFLSSSAHERAYREVLKETGVTDFRYEDVAGMRTDQAFRKILGAQTTDSQIKAFAARKSDLASQYLTANPPLIADCHEVVLGFRELARLALASSSGRRNVELFLKSSGTQEAFDVVLSGDQVTRAKPDPEIYRLALERLGLAASECLVVEDAESGVQAALAAGIRVATVGSHARELSPGNTQVVGRFGSVSDLLKALKTVEACA